MSVFEETWVLDYLPRTERPYVVNFFCRDQIEEACGYEIDRLTSGTAQLLDYQTIEESGLKDECNIAAHLDLEGGKRKRKKKDYKGRPKKIKHKHKKRSKAALEYYNVEASGKVKKLKVESPMCEPGKFSCYKRARLHGAWTL